MAVWLWNFWVFSFLGWCLERLFAAVTRSPQQRRRCLLLLPLCPVYGLGMAAVLALPPLFLSGWRLYVFGGLTATAGGIAAAVVFGLLMAVLFRPSDKRHR